MRNKIGWTSFFWLWLLQLALPLSAAIPHSYFDIETGYRWDKLDNKVTIFGKVDPFAASTEIFKNISSYQLGASARWMGCTHLYIKAQGHYGWIGSGDYDEVTFNGDLKGHTWDVMGAVGYNICVNCCWSIIPLVGYGYDCFSIKAINVTQGFVLTPSNDPGPVGNIDVKQTIQAPFVGIDLLCQPFCCVDLIFGYELHFGRWRGDRFPSEGDLGNDFGRIPGFAAKRTHNQMWGHVFEIGGLYYFGCDNSWNIGFDVRFQFWKGQNTGNFERTRTLLVGPDTAEHPVVDVDWQSFSSLIKLGYSF